MADFAWQKPRQHGIKRAGPQVLETPTVPRHSDPSVEDRTMPFPAYNIRSGGLKPEQNSTFKAIGELAADPVRKTGAQ